MTARAAGALAAAAALGPFFALNDAAGPGWVSWTDLVDHPEPLDRRVQQVASLLAAGPGAPVVPVRVAASIAQLGLVARVLSPAVGAVLAAGVVPVLPAGSVRLHLRGSNPLPMAFVDPSVVPVGGAAEAARVLDREWIEGLADALSAVVRRRYRLSPLVAEGNIASAVAGALRAAVTVRPALTDSAGAVLDALLTAGSLAGRGRLRGDSTFARRSCCLMYRLPGAGTCGDCVLANEPWCANRPSV